VLKGLIPGAVTYGYARPLDARGNPIPGERTINKAEARVLNRIYEEYANRVSPKTIAVGLNLDNIPAPGGGKWNYATFTGGRNRRGIIGNRLYKGELVWDQTRNKRKPGNGKMQKELRSEDEWKLTKVPHLQIITDDLWERANAVRKARSLKKWPKGGPQRTQVTPRKDYLMAGLLVCGACGGHMRVANTSRDGTARIACAAAHEHATCKHSKTYDLGRLEAAVINRMVEKLAEPDSIIEIARGYHAEHAERMARVSNERASVEKQVARIEIKQRNLSEAIEDASSAGVIKRLTEQLDNLEAERVALVERLETMSHGNVVDLHPKAIAVYRDNIKQLHTNMRAMGRSVANRAAFRNLVERITVVPTAKRMPYQWAIRGRLAALLGMNLFPTARTTQEIVAAQGRGRTTLYSDNAAPGNPGAPLSQQVDVVELGHFREAA
jgi:site-specific DNA recombinase